jgi:hypothetical protein
MLPQCYYTPLATVTTNGPDVCTRLANLDYYIMGACSASANTSLNPQCPLPQEYVFLSPT